MNYQFDIEIKRLERNDPSLTTLSFSCIKIDICQIKRLSQALEKNKILTKLILCDNQIDGSGIGTLAQGLKVNRTLKELIIYCNPIGVLGAMFLAEEILAVNQSLTRVELFKCKILCQGASYIGKMLKKNKTLKILELNDNEIGLYGGLKLAQGLKINKFLTTLKLNRNKVYHAWANSNIHIFLERNKRLTYWRNKLINFTYCLDQANIFLPCELKMMIWEKLIFNS